MTTTSRTSGIFAGALVALGLVAAGCGGATQSGDRSKAPAKISRAEYSIELAGAGRRVRHAMEGVRTARTQKGLAQRLKRAESLFETAGADLSEVLPAGSAAAAHRRLVDGLSELAKTAAAARDEVKAGDICAAPSAVARLSRSAGGRRVRSAETTLRARGYRGARRLAPTATKMPNRRLANGAILRQAGGGYATLTVRNGTSMDGVVKLTTTAKRTVLALYVRHGGSATAGSIATGEYRIYFATGRDWDGGRNTFTRHCDFTRFDDTASYTASTAGFTITLHPVIGGGATTSGIGAGEFPR